jgi:hypothetical protein
MRLLPWESKAKLKKAMEIKPPPPLVGYRFTLKGSPRHYDDVKAIIQAKGDAKVFFGEALAYERGAGVALWRVSARAFDWLPDLYAWWAEMERVEPIQFTFHLYFPENPDYPALDLREHSAADVAAYIAEHAPWEGRRPASAARTAP